MNGNAHQRSRTFLGIDPLVLGGTAALGLVTLAMVFAGDGHLGIALAPVALTLVVLAVLRIPVRHSMLVLGFLCLTLENPGDVFASNKWQSPFQVLGALLLGHLNVTIPIKALFLSGADLLLLLIALVWVVRRMSASQRDALGDVPPAAPLRSAALLAIGTILLVWGIGLLRAEADLGKSLWQVKAVIYLPCIFLLCCACFRGPADGRRLGLALLLAALLRAGMAIYVRHLFPSFEDVPHATSHADSMLFADAFLLVVAIFFERPSRRNLLLLTGILPPLGWAMVANNRRLVWVELLAGILVFSFAGPLTGLKRKTVRALLVCAPLLLLYFVVGWQSSSRLFGPVQAIRSVGDASDPSTRWRDFENYDLAVTVRANPLLGTGLGHPYDEVIRLPDISTAYELYRHVPHNGVLAAFAYTGAIGFVGIWLIIPLGIFFAARSYRLSGTPRDRAAMLAAIGIFVVYLIHCYGDMGLGTWTSLFTVGPALALVAKQAVATGAWRSRSRAVVL